METNTTEFYRSLFDNMFEGLAYCQMIFDKNKKPVDFLYLQVNKNFEKLTGLKNVVGKKVSELLPDLRKTNPEVFEIYGRVAASGKPEKFEVNLEQLKSGYEISVYCPQKGYFVAVFQKITEVKESLTALHDSEEKFRQLTENIQEVFWMTDPTKNKMLYISPAYENIWGRTVKSLYENPKNWLEAIHPDERDRVLKAAISKQTKGTYNEQYRIVRPDGDVRWIQDRAFPIKDGKGQIYRVVGIAQDITYTKKTEDELKKRNDELENLNKTMVGRELKMIELKKELEKFKQGHE